MIGGETSCFLGWQSMSEKQQTPREAESRVVSCRVHSRPITINKPIDSTQSIFSVGDLQATTRVEQVLVVAADRRRGWSLENARARQPATTMPPPIWRSSTCARLKRRLEQSPHSRLETIESPTSSFLVAPLRSSSPSPPSSRCRFLFLAAVSHQQAPLSPSSSSPCSSSCPTAVSTRAPSP